MTTTWGVGTRFTVTGMNTRYIIRAFMRERGRYGEFEIYWQALGTDGGVFYDAGSIQDNFDRGAWIMESTDVTTRPDMYDGSIFDTAGSIDNTLRWHADSNNRQGIGDSKPAHYSVGYNQRPEWSVERVAELFETGIWHKTGEQTVTEEMTDTVTDTVTANDTDAASLELVVDRLRSELATVQNDRNDLADRFSTMQRQRIDLLAYLAEVAEDPSKLISSVDERMCESFDAAMIRNGGYTRSEVEDAREKASPEVNVDVTYTVTVTMPRRDLNSSDIHNRAIELLDAYSMDWEESD